MRRTAPRTGRPLALVAALLATWAGGCATRGIEIHEYVLTSVASPGLSDSVRPPGELLVSVGPVVLPSYLRRDRIVRRLGANQVHTSETHRWGEDLARGLARIVAENLEAELPAARVHPLPRRDPRSADYRVAIDVERFEAQPDGSVELVARWSLTHGDEALLERRTRIAESAGSDYATIVAGMSRAAAQLSRAIADAIRDELEPATAVE